MSGRSALETLGSRPYQARTLAQRIRRHSIAQLQESAPHFGDEARRHAATEGDNPGATP